MWTIRKSNPINPAWRKEFERLGTYGVRRKLSESREYESDGKTDAAHVWLAEQERKSRLIAVATMWAAFAAAVFGAAAIWI
jgi:hypothetical protein